MSTKMTNARYLSMTGYNSDRGIFRVKKLICFRKGTSIQTAKKLVRRKKFVFGVISAHNLYRTPNSIFIKLWMHCFRDPNKKFSKKIPKILLSESDFVDPRFIICKSRSNNPKWDFYYFTTGREAKGWSVFLSCLPILCDKFKLKGIVIQYAGLSSIRCNIFKNKIIRRYRKYLKIKRKKMKPVQIANIMASSRFGFFPNTADCSPLMLSESLVRDCPVVVNEQILGGWKYINNNTGLFFNKNNLSRSIKQILNKKFSPNSDYMKKYGFLNTSSRLANFCNDNIRGFPCCDKLVFSKHTKMLRSITCKAKKL